MSQPNSQTVEIICQLALKVSWKAWPFAKNKILFILGKWMSLNIFVKTDLPYELVLKL